MIHVQNAAETAARRHAVQRRVHDAHLDLAAVRHHRLVRRRRGDDGAAGRAARWCRRRSTRRSASAARWRHGAAARTAPGGSRSGSRRLAERARERATGRTGSCARARLGTASRGWPTNHVMVDPIKVTILSPGLSADGPMAEHGNPGGGRRQVPLVAPDRDRENRPLFVPRPLLDGRSREGKWSTLVTELINFKDLYDANAPLSSRAAGPRGCASRGLCGIGSQGPLRSDPPRSIGGRCGAEGAARDVHRPARDGDAAGRCLRPAGQREGRKRRDRRPHGPNACRDGRALSAGHSPHHAGRADHASDEVDPGLPPLRPQPSTASSRASRPTSMACASRPAKAGGGTSSTASIEEGGR